MQHENSDNAASDLRRGVKDPVQGRFPDLSNLPKPRWRDALIALAAPATRLHQYRNLRTAMFDEATRDLDCKDQP